MKYPTLSLPSLLSRIFAALIGILGFSSCSSEEYMYGTPTSSFEVKGRVFTEEGYLFEGAEITASNPNNPGSPYETFGPVESDSHGCYSIAGSINSNVIKVVCVVPDGSYQSE